MTDLRINFLERVWNLLVEKAGANPAPHAKSTFVSLHMDDKFPCTEFRFQGDFGFGGKYRLTRNKIDYYRENETPALDKREKQINEDLALLATEMGVTQEDLSVWTRRGQ